MLSDKILIPKKIAERAEAYQVKIATEYLYDCAADKLIDKYGWEYAVNIIKRIRSYAFEHDNGNYTRTLSTSNDDHLYVPSPLDNKDFVPRQYKKEFNAEYCTLIPLLTDDILNYGESWLTAYADKRGDIAKNSELTYLDIDRLFVIFSFDKAFNQTSKDEFFIAYVKAVSNASIVMQSSFEFSYKKENSSNNGVRQRKENYDRQMMVKKPVLKLIRSWILEIENSLDPDCINAVTATKMTDLIIQKAKERSENGRSLWDIWQADPVKITSRSILDFVRDNKAL